MVKSVAGKDVDGYMDTGIEAGGCRSGCRRSPGWQMREQMEALLGGQTSRSWSGAMRDGWGRLPDFVFVYENPKSGGDEEML